MYVELLAILLIQSTLAASICECSNADLKDLLDFQAKFKKLNEEKDKFPKNENPDRASVKVLVDHCKDLLKFSESIKCSQMQQFTGGIKKTCEMLEFLGGPYNECPKKLTSSTSSSECATWLMSDKVDLSQKEQCAGFRQRRDCIQKEVGKTCGAEAEKSFKENDWIFEKFMGCV